MNIKLYNAVKAVGATLASVANSNDPYVPEIWANEALAILLPNMVVANMVNRNFSNEIAQFGDVINTRRPDSFTMRRKTDTDQLVVQAATSTNVAIPLNQHLHTAFIIKDGEESKGMANLVDIYLRRAIESIAVGIDQLLLCNVHQFYGTSAGKFGTSLTQPTIAQLRKAMNDNYAYMSGRNLIVTSQQETDLLGIDNFVTAEKTGDQGTAIREASLGRRFGFDIFMCQQAPNIAAGNTNVTGAVNYSLGYAAGSTSITVDGLSAAITAGSWCTIGGDMTPQKITASAGGATPTSITIYPGLKSAVVDDAVVTIYTPGAVNLSGGYAANYAGKDGIVVDGFTVAPKLGQGLSFGADANFTGNYGLISAGSSTSPVTTRIDVDRGLVEAINDDEAACITPPGQYGFAFHPDALTLVSRPLAPPRAGLGARSAVASANGVGLRVTISYQHQDQGHLVSVDLLAGTKVLDPNLGAVLYS
jgi:hypothetical protein